MFVRVVQKGGKGKGKKEAKGEEGVELTDAQKVEKANLRIEALERELGAFCPLILQALQRGGSQFITSRLTSPYHRCSWAMQS